MKNLVLTILAISIVGIAGAQTPKERGLEIAKAAEQADLGFNSSTVELKMTLKNKNGQTSERLLTTRWAPGRRIGPCGGPRRVQDQQPRPGR